MRNEQILIETSTYQNNRIEYTKKPKKRQRIAQTKNLLHRQIFDLAKFIFRKNLNEQQTKRLIDSIHKNLTKTQANLMNEERFYIHIFGALHNLLQKINY